MDIAKEEDTPNTVQPSTVSLTAMNSSMSEIDVKRTDTPRPVQKFLERETFSTKKVSYIVTSYSLKLENDYILRCH